MSQFPIAFDLSPTGPGYSPGVQQATRGLFEALCASGELEWIGLEPPDPKHSSLLWRQLKLPSRAAKLGCVGLHSPVSAFPWRTRLPVVHTVHELPWRRGVEEHAGARHRFWAHRGSARARATICPAEHTAAELLVAQPRARARVVHWGCEPQLLLRPLVSSEAREHLLQLGATRAKKALDCSIRALAGPQLQELQLVFTGPSNPTSAAALALAAELGVEHRVRHVEHVPEAQLVELLAHACALLCPSHSEGFGLPVLEALALGTPAVVRHATAPSQWARGSVIEVRPEQPLEYAFGIRRALDATPAERESLRAAAAGFTWARAADQVRDVWNESLGSVSA